MFGWLRPGSRTPRADPEGSGSQVGPTAATASSATKTITSAGVDVTTIRKGHTASHKDPGSAVSGPSPVGGEQRQRQSVTPLESPGFSPNNGQSRPGHGRSCSAATSETPVTPWHATRNSSSYWDGYAEDELDGADDAELGEMDGEVEWVEFASPMNNDGTPSFPEPNGSTPLRPSPQASAVLGAASRSYDGDSSAVATPHIRQAAAAGRISAAYATPSANGNGKVCSTASDINSPHDEMLRTLHLLQPLKEVGASPLAVGSPQKKQLQRKRGSDVKQSSILSETGPSGVLDQVYYDDEVSTEGEDRSASAPRRRSDGASEGAPVSCGSSRVASPRKGSSLRVRRNSGTGAKDTVLEPEARAVQQSVDQLRAAFEDERGRRAEAGKGRSGGPPSSALKRLPMSPRRTLGRTGRDQPVSDLSSGGLEHMNPVGFESAPLIPMTDLPRGPMRSDGLYFLVRAAVVTGGEHLVDMQQVEVTPENLRAAMHFSQSAIKRKPKDLPREKKKVTSPRSAQSRSGAENAKDKYKVGEDHSPQADDEMRCASGQPSSSRSQDGADDSDDDVAAEGVVRYYIAKDDEAEELQRRLKLHATGTYTTTIMAPGAAVGSQDSITTYSVRLRDGSWKRGRLLWAQAGLLIADEPPDIYRVVFIEFLQLVSNITFV